MTSGIFVVLFDTAANQWASRRLDAEADELTISRIIYSGSSVMHRTPRLNKNYIYLLFQSSDAHEETMMLKGTPTDKARDYFLKRIKAADQDYVNKCWRTAGYNVGIPTVDLPYFDQHKLCITNFVPCKHVSKPRIGTPEEVDVYYKQRYEAKQALKAALDAVKHNTEVQSAPVCEEVSDTAAAAERAYVTVVHFNQYWVPPKSGLLISDAQVGHVIYRVLHFAKLGLSTCGMVNLVLDRKDQLLEGVPADAHNVLLTRIIDQIYELYTVPGVVNACEHT